MIKDLTEFARQLEAGEEFEVFTTDIWLKGLDPEMYTVCEIMDLINNCHIRVKAKTMELYEVSDSQGRYWITNIQYKTTHDGMGCLRKGILTLTTTQEDTDNG